MSPHTLLGLATPPETPEMELENRLGGLALKKQQQPVVACCPPPTSAPSLPPGMPPPSPAPTSRLASPPPPLRPAQTAPPVANAAAGDDDAHDDEDGGGGGGGRSFHLFPLLPAELRIKIWKMSFEPRVVELHTRRLHYATDFRHGGTLRWQSSSANPPALSVCVEAREVALSHYRVVVPLAVSPPAGRSHPSHPWHTAGSSAGDDVADEHHALYLDASEDTVALLGEVDLTKLRSFFLLVSKDDPRGGGPRRLGLSTACFRRGTDAAMLSVYARTVLRDLDELVLFMYADTVPPEGWRQGRCVLEECEGKDFFRRWEMSGGDRLRKEDGSWLVVGKKEMVVRDLVFLPSPTTSSSSTREKVVPRLPEKQGLADPLPVTWLY